jgi:hypothetical protein
VEFLSSACLICCTLLSLIDMLLNGEVLGRGTAGYMQAADLDGGLIKRGLVREPMTDGVRLEAEAGCLRMGMYIAQEASREISSRAER